MMPTVIELLVRFMGGFWKLKQTINCAKHGIWRKYGLAVYYLYLRNYGSFIGHTAVFDGRATFPSWYKRYFYCGWK